MSTVRVSAVRSGRFPKWIELIARLALAGVFLYAGISKIVDPPGFAHELSNYRLLPAAAVAPMALVLPWLEVICGALLAAGIWKREAAIVLAALLAVFVAALSIDLARGVAVDCGCFGGAKPARTPAERLADMRMAIARDVLLFLLALPVLLRRRPQAEVLEDGTSGGSESEGPNTQGRQFHG